jgi:sorbitol/mannitol transport system permease protein
VVGGVAAVFFSIFWMVLSSFKTELQAIAVPPLLFFEPTLENFSLIEERTDYIGYALNSIITRFGGTLLALVIAIPSAFSMAFSSGKYTKDILLWMLSTKMLPAVDVPLPIYLIAQKLGLLDTTFVLIFIYAMMNFPIIMWILFTYFRAIPKDILEAARMDGCSTWREIVQVVLPLAWGGIASKALLSIVLCWNEAFWPINLTSSDAGTLTALVASF